MTAVGDWHLDHVTIESFRCFKRFEIDFNPSPTVLVGVHGSGKRQFLTPWRSRDCADGFGRHEDGVGPRQDSPHQTHISLPTIHSRKSPVWHPVSRSRQKPVARSTVHTTNGNTSCRARQDTRHGPRTQRLDPLRIRGRSQMQWAWRVLCVVWHGLKHR